MTLKPTITSSKGANTVLSSSEWNTSVIQSDNYLQELVAGTNADKIGGSALANPLGLGALTATTATFSGALTANHSGNQIGGDLAIFNNGSTAGNLTVAGSTTLTGGVSGPVAASGAVQSNGHPVVEGTAAATHVECIAGQSAGGVAGGASASVTLTFARAFSGEPAWSASCQTSSGNASNWHANLTSISTSAITVAFVNQDANPQTLSHMAITATGN